MYNKKIKLNSLFKKTNYGRSSRVEEWLVRGLGVVGVSEKKNSERVLGIEEEGTRNLIVIEIESSIESRLKMAWIFIYKNI